MTKQRRETKYFVVKHGLDSFQALPNYIWRTGMGPKSVPRNFARLEIGDKWIAFAYTTGDLGEKPLSMVNGFYECTHACVYRDIPLTETELRVLCKTSGSLPKKAWMIEGIESGRQPKYPPVAVPPLEQLLDRCIFTRQTLTQVSAKEFDHIRMIAIKNPIAPVKIEPLGREPETEQELLAIVAHEYKRLGIEKILKIRKAFPDMLVKLRGRREPVHLELEKYSSGFFQHGHNKQVKQGRFTDGRAVAVLCWIDNNQKVKNSVHGVYELKTLLATGRTIEW